MILDSVTLQNFGAYRGTQTAELTPLPGKPIILFGGMNGGGKTTLLEAVQLAFYGPKARIASRGRQGYKEYLRDSIHRGVDPTEGAAISIAFRRMVDGAPQAYVVRRHWQFGAKGIEEALEVSRDGVLDPVMTDQWDEVIDAYLPSSIAHLFFFDGEQVKELAEGTATAEILGTAIQSLLGLDLVDRLETDLKVFERRKRLEVVDASVVAEIQVHQTESERVQFEYGQLCVQEGALQNELDMLAKSVTRHEVQFRTEGGELFQRRRELEEALARSQAEHAQAERSLRESAAGALPLLMIQEALRAVECQVRHEQSVREAKTLTEALSQRDRHVLAELKAARLPSANLSVVEKALKADRDKRVGLSKEPMTLNAPLELAVAIEHQRSAVAPDLQRDAQSLVDVVRALDEQNVRLMAELARVPTADRIAVIQAELVKARDAHRAKQAELDMVRTRMKDCLRLQGVAEAKLDNLGARDHSHLLSTDERQRMLKHSAKVRTTLDKLRTSVVSKHTAKLEALMLESFQKLLHKTHLVTGLKINPTSFETTLTGDDGKPLPFDRLSAGERQLLATSLLWGLARASGRPIPTLIDTPLGRLDSTHRLHLAQRYFPAASHQVILLSTDQEISGDYLKAVKPFVSRRYLLQQEPRSGCTRIEEGYFA